MIPVAARIAVPAKDSIVFFGPSLPSETNQELTVVSRPFTVHPPTLCRAVIVDVVKGEKARIGNGYTCPKDIDIFLRTRQSFQVSCVYAKQGQTLDRLRNKPNRELVVFDRSRTSLCFCSGDTWFRRQVPQFLPLFLTWFVL